MSNRSVQSSSMQLLLSADFKQNCSTYVKMQPFDSNLKIVYGVEFVITFLITDKAKDILQSHTDKNNYTETSSKQKWNKNKLSHA